MIGAAGPYTIGAEGGGANIKVATWCRGQVFHACISMGLPHMVDTVDIVSSLHIDKIFQIHIYQYIDIHIYIYILIYTCI